MIKKQTFAILALSLWIFAGCDDLKDQTLLSLSTMEVKTVALPTAELTFAGVTNLADKTFCGIDYSAVVLTDFPYYSSKNKSNNPKLGCAISDLLTEAKIEELTEADSAASGAGDLRSLYSVSFTSVWEELLVPISWQNFSCEKTYEEKSYKNSWIVEGGKNLTVSYVDCMPETLSDPTSAPISLDYRIDNAKSAGFYRSLTVSSLKATKNVIVASFEAQKLSWNDKDAGTIVNATVIPLLWFFESIDSESDYSDLHISCSNLAGTEDETVVAKDCYYIVTRPVESGESTDRGYAGAILKITGVLKQAKGTIKVLHPTSMIDEELLSY